MFTETQSMKDLHKIREELYNETRCLNPKERIAYLNNEAEKIRHLIRPRQESMGDVTVKEV